MKHSSHGSRTNIAHMQIFVKLKASAALFIFIFLIPLISGLCADSQKEYIYQDEKVVAVESDVCTSSISPTNASPAAGGASGSVTVASSCPWTATSNATSWITITTGVGGKTVSYTVAANTGTARTGTITIAGKTFTVSQNGLNLMCIQACTASKSSCLQSVQVSCTNQCIMQNPACLYYPDLCTQSCIAPCQSSSEAACNSAYTSCIAGCQ